MAKAVAETFPMNGGEGVHSYTQNSSHQRDGLNSSKAVIDEAIAEKLDITSFSTSDPFTIADFGCSTGPNTFVVVQNVVDAIKLKYQKCPSLSRHIPEFQVYFNDHIDNDFNTLFKSIPLEKKYFAAGVPGSFYGRLFPKASLHFVHSSYALQWLSTVPSELLDKNSPARNKGRVTYGNAPDEVVKAFKAQFEKDMSSFLNARAEEVIPGGLMALLLVATPDEIPSPKSIFIGLFDLMGSCLMDMAKIGILSEAEIDSFNLPVYSTTRKEMEELVEINGGFTIEDMEQLIHMAPDAEKCSKHLRAGMENVFKEHFGSDIMDELFDRFTKKIEESLILSEGSLTPNELFVILKRKETVVVGSGMIRRAWWKDPNGFEVMEVGLVVVVAARLEMVVQGGCWGSVFGGDGGRVLWWRMGEGLILVEAKVRDGGGMGEKVGC
ncbi:hypothetical protein IFM89_033319 [Coptis chinensis]|uniref:S-adenosylmethionine-dependent methyltransferase n=1 Tax=Coptis chinensis TaxID=261450 RepID=A0A835LPM0_9MAGN|nr:hypothetical protein IFM89_033319 [Coptis chinensis]